tara:strand:+ start:449 stop:757 length:309 start_codon:yes stop_codon:yes gene_type:complete
MKKLVFLLVCSFLISCGSYMNVSQVTEQVEIGMTKDEFLKIAKNRAEKDAMYSDYYVYRVNQYDLNGYKVDSMFYYFRTSDDTLIEVNAGTRAKDVNVNINN